MKRKTGSFFSELSESSFGSFSITRTFKYAVLYFLC